MEGLNDNWCALYAAIINPKLSSVKALMCFGIRLDEIKEGRKKPVITKRYERPRKYIDVEEAWKLYEKGATLRDLARKYSVGMNTVRDRFIETGRKCRGQNNNKGRFKAQHEKKAAS